MKMLSLAAIAASPFRPSSGRDRAPLQPNGRLGFVAPMKLILAIAGFVALATPAAEAYAQVVGTYRVRVGLGAQVRPEYLGADSTEIVPYPTVSIKKGEEPFGFGAPDDSFGIGLLGNDTFSLGPVLALSNGRDEDEVGAPVGDVNRTLEAGAFAQYELSDAFRLRAELRQGIGGHEGLVGNVGADYVTRDGDNYLFSIGPRLRFGDGKFQRAFFGIDDEAALASGLPLYRPDSGLYAVGAVSSARYEIGGGWGLFGFARYDRLVGDARKSPIVEEFGSDNQFSAGIGISRTFTLKL
jgi:outer membrane protein